MQLISDPIQWLTDEKYNFTIVILVSVWLSFGTGFLSFVKPLNEQIYYLVDNINTAINRRKKISFNYYHYNQYRKEVPNNNGKSYCFSPYYLV